MNNGLCQGWAVGPTIHPFGYILLQGTSESYDIVMLLVAVKHRKQGIGRKLLQVVKVKLKSDLFIEVSENNTSAIRLYKSEGFMCIGRRPNYYRDQSDALLLNFTR